jgi:AcrR family transcriptional regulator
VSISNSLSPEYVGKIVTKRGVRAPARRGRPCLITELERRGLLLDAAERVFVELGYTEASMDDIARRAGMSKKTLYQLYDTKEALFVAVIAARRAELAQTLSADDISDSLPAEFVLRHFLLGFARFLLAPRQAALYRLMIAEVHRTPELARAMHQDCPGKLCHFLQNWIARQNALGILDVSDPEMAAGMLFSMVIAEPQMRAFMCEGNEADLSFIEGRVESAVKLFLDGARPRASVSTQKKPSSGKKKTGDEERG